MINRRVTRIFADGHQRRTHKYFWLTSWLATPLCTDTMQRKKRDGRCRANASLREAQ